MRVIIDKAAFLTELNTLRAVFGEKDNVTPNVFLATGPDALHIASNDARARITGQAKAKVVRDGTITMNGGQFYTLFKMLPNGEVILEALDNGWLAISTGDFDAKLPALSVSDTGMTTEAMTHQSKLKADDISRLISETRFIIQRADEVNERTKGALLELGNDAARMVTTDGHRLAISEVGTIPDEPSKLFISRKAIGQMKAVLDGHKGDVTIDYSDRAFHLTAGTRELTALLIQGAYPPYRRVLPPAGSIVATVDLGTLQQAIKRTALIASTPEDCSVFLEFREGGELVVASRDPVEGNTAEESMSSNIVADSPLPRRLKFAGRYINDAVAAIDDESVTISIQPEELKQVVLKAANKPDNGLQLIMPQAADKPDIKKEKKKNAKAA